MYTSFIRKLFFQKVYVGKVRAILNKLPGFFFSGYEQSRLFAEVVTSMDNVLMKIQVFPYQFKSMMFDHFKAHPDSWLQYNKTMKDKGYSYGIPKGWLMVTLKKGTSAFERNIVIDGLQ